ncbi:MULTISPECIES: GNAT family N-acetyltransferase [Streptomyces]|uniref:N-acetyltransferase domain-containing protein n=1 Tax=Streptomyces cacaoi TaxID=1898 RepID=A0A4Y3QU28_STRCI|nr:MULTISPECIES: GNAT family N-acetyltransferase [Streptomyces]NNG83505.1 GNAT family N-acetyltransferase [Streptomyces cacaoi]QHF95952.1 N-acetyltransferase [Streptomyces sp. NHF165]GEB47530.1 hypothetical protein SCA03_00810 [Streptomyces cacaoi]
MDGGGNIEITTVAERPELTGPLTAIDDDWPVFVVQDPVACALWDSVPVDFAAYCVVATEGTRVVARGFAVPFDGESAGRTPTPDGGWDTVLTWAHADRRAGRRTPTASALEVTVDRAHLGRGLSSRMVAALCEAARRQGHDALYAPVRPTHKHLRPRLPLDAYVRERRADGLPVDPWLRVHVRAGATIEKVAPASMTVSGSLAQWRTWTGLPFDADGPVEVPGALVPVRCDTAHDQAVYVEPNVWLRHGGDGAAR